MKKLIGALICPHCKAKQQMQIPLNVCMAFYQCNNCKKINKAKDGCCVFCSYGDKPCPVAPHPH